MTREAAPRRLECNQTRRYDHIGQGSWKSCRAAMVGQVSVQVTENPVTAHDLHTTILHLLGLDHLKLTYGFQGRDFRLADVAGNVVRNLIEA